MTKMRPDSARLAAADAATCPWAGRCIRVQQCLDINIIYDGNGHDNDSNGHDDDTGPTMPKHQRHDHGDGHDNDSNGHDTGPTVPEHQLHLWWGMVMMMTIMIKMLITKMIMMVLMIIRIQQRLQIIIMMIIITMITTLKYCYQVDHMRNISIASH